MRADGERLRIRGPRRAEPIVQRLIAHKADVLAALTAPPADHGIRVEDLDMDWRVEWEERAAIMEYDGGLPRERAEALALAQSSARWNRPAFLSAAMLDIPARMDRMQAWPNAEPN